MAVLAALLLAGGCLASALGATGEHVGRDDVTVVPVMAVATTEKLSALLNAAASGEVRVPIAATHSLEDAALAWPGSASTSAARLSSLSADGRIVAITLRGAQAARADPAMR